MSFDGSFVAHGGIISEMIFTRSLSNFMLLLCNRNFKETSCLALWGNASEKEFSAIGYFQTTMNAAILIVYFPHTAKIGYSSSPAEGINGLIGSEFLSINGWGLVS